jgi:hypothetical protein
MTIKFPCCSCGNKLKAPPALAGRRAKCPRCSHVVAVPRPKADQSPELTRILQAPVSCALPDVAEPKSALALIPTRAVQLAGKEKVFWFGLGSGVAVSILLWGVLAFLMPARAGGETRPAESTEPTTPMTVIEVTPNAETAPARETTSEPDKVRERRETPASAPLSSAAPVSADPKTAPPAAASETECALRQSVAEGEKAVAILLQMLEKDRPPPPNVPLKKSEIVNTLAFTFPRLESAAFEAGVVRLADVGNLSATQVLAEWTQEEVRPVLMRLARRGGPAQAEIALDGLVRNWPREGAVIFRDALKSANPSLVRLALRGLGRCECSVARELITPFVNHGDKYVSRAAGDALRELSKERSSEGTVSVLAQ